MIPLPRSRSLLRKFLRQESAGGVILMMLTVAALFVANSAFAPVYFQALQNKIAGISVLHWINDGLMAAFFLFVGLEIKRELLDGALATWPGRALPGIAAAGGMIVPALIYLALTAGDAEALRGWAIPAGTDIAFALAILSLLGTRVPVSLKIFLTALAILDDLGAILIIAFFYTADISLTFFGLAAITLAALFAINRVGVIRLAPYLVLGTLLWLFVLKSGIHATLAGVALAATVPLKPKTLEGRIERAPLHRLEHALSPWVAFVVVPIFGFANAGVSLSGVAPSVLCAPVPLGIAAGLFLGKQLGVFGSAWIAVKLRLADLPAHATWAQLYGTAMLCGIGFTMSLFIGLLAFDDPTLHDQAKFGVLAGSILSAIGGALVFMFTKRVDTAAGISNPHSE